MKETKINTPASVLFLWSCDCLLPGLIFCWLCLVLRRESRFAIVLFLCFPTSLVAIFGSPPVVDFLLLQFASRFWGVSAIYILLVLSFFLLSAVVGCALVLLCYQLIPPLVLVLEPLFVFCLVSCETPPCFFNGADTGTTFRRRKDSPTGAFASLHHRKALARSATCAGLGAPKTHWRCLS